MILLTRREEEQGNHEERKDIDGPAKERPYDVDVQEHSEVEERFEDVVKDDDYDYVCECPPEMLQVQLMKFFALQEYIDRIGSSPSVARLE